MPLTDTRLRALKPKAKPYKVADERGLYIEVTPAGGKHWRFRYRIGKAKLRVCRPRQAKSDIERLQGRNVRRPGVVWSGPRHLVRQACRIVRVTCRNPRES